MAEEDPFADLGETLDDEADGADEPSGDSDAAGGADRDPLTDRAFSYEAAVQRPFYAREATVEAFDAWLNYELERELDDRGYREIVVREMTDALLRTVVEEDLVDEVAERFESARANPDDDSKG
ncbi:hypothetical protein [Candidatus Halobonum tyrrellensis]|uniref:Uncharacterized protein n=1 Tax=Candidatus Halobonum tyrrellensis G22 TaxID=1324957 RepID=V4HQH9_9EURY|nr:hypothetical protein [Candidatus Halobonum tyrrellensis]ESP90174.1 hypothetical protein K933_01397 [Candidatus Halobonum tyrrellensis G22]